jgi:hypothetical protein
MLKVTEPGERHLSGLFSFLLLLESIHTREYKDLHGLPDGMFLAESS